MSSYQALLVSLEGNKAALALPRPAPPSPAPSRPVAPHADLPCSTLPRVTCLTLPHRIPAFPCPFLLYYTPLSSAFPLIMHHPCHLPHLAPVVSFPCPAQVFCVHPTSPFCTLSHLTNFCPALLFPARSQRPCLPCRSQLGRPAMACMVSAAVELHAPVARHTSHSRALLCPAEHFPAPSMWCMGSEHTREVTVITGREMKKKRYTCIYEIY